MWQQFRKTQNQMFQISHFAKFAKCKIVATLLLTNTFVYIFSCLFTRLLTFARCKSAWRGQSFWTWKPMTSTISHTTSLWWHQMVDHEIWAVLNCQFQLRSTTIFWRLNYASHGWNSSFIYVWMGPWKTEIKLYYYIMMHSEQNEL